MYKKIASWRSLFYLQLESVVLLENIEQTVTFCVGQCIRIIFL